jgi:hypothetical protein
VHVDVLRLETDLTHSDRAWLARVLGSLISFGLYVIIFTDFHLDHIYLHLIQCWF